VAAVTNQGRALRFASKDFRNNLDVVETAVHHDRGFNVFRLASKEVQSQLRAKWGH
jgi:hypothetical protein